MNESSTDVFQDEFLQRIEKIKPSLFSLEDIFSVFREMNLPEDSFYSLAQKLLAQKILLDARGFILMANRE